MNILQHKQIVVDYWIWEPTSKLAREDEDRILSMKHANTLLPHCGYVKVSFHELDTIDPNKTVKGETNV